jgi:predicted RNA-binding Zn ribbon-like protein
VVARAALELFGAQRDALVKQCGRETCTRVYIDRSRGGRRTWCGMAECGDRVKAANYRRRKRSATS